MGPRHSEIGVVCDAGQASTSRQKRGSRKRFIVRFLRVTTRMKELWVLRETDRQTNRHRQRGKMGKYFVEQRYQLVRLCSVGNNTNE